jgi:hypothetical protein
MSGRVTIPDKVGTGDDRTQLETLTQDQEQDIGLLLRAMTPCSRTSLNNILLPHSVQANCDRLSELSAHPSWNSWTGLMLGPDAFRSVLLVRYSGGKISLHDSMTSGVCAVATSSVFSYNYARQKNSKF